VARDTAAAAGFGLQAAAVPAWWLLLWWVPGSQALFFPSPGIDPTMRAFVVPDLVVLAGASGAAAWLIRRGDRRAPLVSWFAAGAACYAAAFTVAWAVRAGAPALAPLLMLASAVLSVTCAVLAVSRSR
jgi:hypothetical protein